MLPTLSRLSVSYGPGIRLRHRCSSRYLRIPPLHLEFRFPLPHSRYEVSKAGSELSPDISPQTFTSAYTLFTPSDSGQRLLPPYYRGCWHGVSRSFRYRYRLSLAKPEHSSLLTVVYTRKSFIPHAAWLHQTFVHCAIFLTAASRRSLGRISVPVWLIILSDQLPIVALVSRYLTNKLMGRRLILQRPKPLVIWPGDLMTSCGISTPFGMLFPTEGQIAYALLTRSPLSSLSEEWDSRSTCMC